MVLPKSAKIIIAFSDGSHLIAELTKAIGSSDNVLHCINMNENPKISAGPKTSIANMLLTLSKANQNKEVIIPMTRIIGIGVLEEQLSISVSKDVEEMWRE